MAQLATMEVAIPAGERMMAVRQPIMVVQVVVRMAVAAVQVAIVVMA
jgi:hypothetical protein